MMIFFFKWQFYYRVAFLFKRKDRINKIKNSFCHGAFLLDPVRQQS